MKNQVPSLMVFLPNQRNAKVKIPFRILSIKEKIDMTLKLRDGKILVCL